MAGSRQEADRRESTPHGSVEDLPPCFVAWLHEAFAREDTEQILATLKRRPLIVRVNTARAVPPQVFQQLRQDGFRLEPLSFLPYAAVVRDDEARTITTHPLVMDGTVYLQSFASLLVPCALQPSPGERVLDLCAAPGSKSTQIAMLMEFQGELVVNEPAHARFFKLRAALERSGALAAPHFVTMTKLDGYRLLGRYRNYFDRVLVDAPCSGEARFVRGEPATFEQWKPRQRKVSASLQKKLLGAAFQMARPGGIVVYSTCTMAPQENEEIAAWALKKFGDLVELEPLPTLPAEPLFLREGGALGPPLDKFPVRFRPTELLESFFVARFRRAIQ